MACDSGGCSTSCYTGTKDCSCGDGCKGGCSSCSGDCGGGCKGTCSDSCSGGCSSGCSGCSGGCKGGCRGCGSACSSSCAATCTDSCNNGCTGETTTNIYERIGLNTLILSSDIIDLRDMAFHEAARSAGSAWVGTTTEAVGEKALYESISIIYDNLTSLGYTLTSEEQYKLMHKDIIQTYIDAAKSAYERCIPAS